MKDADRVVGLDNQIFNISGGPVSVIVFALGGVTDGSGGEDHLGCTFKNGGAIEVCASFGNPARVSALFEAELSAGWHRRPQGDPGPDYRQDGADEQEDYTDKPNQSSAHKQRGSAGGENLVAFRDGGRQLQTSMWAR